MTRTEVARIAAERERQLTKHDLEVERQRVIEEFAQSLVAVRVLTYPRERYARRRARVAAGGER